MSKKKRNIIIISSVLVAIVGILITLSLTVFSLKDITVDFRTSTQNLTATQEEIIQSGEFSKSCVLFYNKNKAKEKIEKKYPYIKVINIETKFPASFVIHVTERQEVYALSKDDKVYYLDEQLKVLRITEEEFVSTSENPIEIKGVGTGLELGEKAEIEGYSDIYSAFLQSNFNLGMQKEIFKEIQFKREYDSNVKQEYLNAYISLFNGQTIKILDTEYGLKYKANLALRVYSSIWSFIGKEYSFDGEEKVVLTQEMLENVKICVQSYYDRNHHKESETYFKLIKAS